MSTNVEQLNENIFTNRNSKRNQSTKIVYMKKSGSKKPMTNNNTMRLENKAKSKIPLQTINENDKNELNIKRKLFDKEDTLTNINEKENSTPFSLESKKEKEENKNNSLNMENLLINISLKEKNNFSQEEYREMF